MRASTGYMGRDDADVNKYLKKQIKRLAVRPPRRWCPITYGTQVIDQRQWTVKGFPQLGASADCLTRFSDWLAVQKGRDDRGNDQLDTTRRFKGVPLRPGQSL